MENYVLNLKNYIKELNAEQVADKLQRKTVHVPEGFVRTKDSWEAAEDVRDRKETLRMLYRIYEIWRDKETTADPNFQSWVNEWSRKRKFDSLFEDVCQRFKRSSNPEA